MMVPHDPAPHRALIVSIGLSPQVVTETLHALWANEGWVPDRLVLIGTRRAAALARSLLLPAESGAIALWAREWQVPGAAALARHAEIVEVPSDTGDLDDERGVAALAECAFRLLSGLVAQPQTTLHVSIAGGRKPAAALLGVLMAVLGRRQDRLSHVLVRPEAAAGAGLFFPARTSRTVIAGGVAFDAAALRLALIDIPFPRLAHSGGPGEDLRAFFARLAPDGAGVRLHIDWRAGRVSWDGVAIVLPPAIAAFIGWLAGFQLGGAEGIPRVGASREGYLACYRRLASETAAARAAARLSEPLEPEWIEEKVARTNKLADARGIRPRGARLVEASGPRARARYRLALERNEIAIAGGAP